MISSGDEIKRRFDGIDSDRPFTYAFSTLGNEEKSLDLLLRYETALHRKYQRALNTLLRLRREGRNRRNRHGTSTSQEYERTLRAP